MTTVSSIAIDSAAAAPGSMQASRLDLSFPLCSRQAGQRPGAGGRQRRAGRGLGDRHPQGPHHTCAAAAACRQARGAVLAWLPLCLKPPVLVQFGVLSASLPRCPCKSLHTVLDTCPPPPCSRRGAGAHQAGAAHAGRPRAVLRRQLPAPDARGQRHNHQVRPGRGARQSGAGRQHAVPPRCAAGLRADAGAAAPLLLPQLHSARRPPGLAGRHVRCGGGRQQHQSCRCSGRGLCRPCWCLEQGLGCATQAGRACTCPPMPALPPPCAALQTRCMWESRRSGCARGSMMCRRTLHRRWNTTGEVEAGLGGLGCLPLPLPLLLLHAGAGAAAAPTSTAAAHTPQLRRLTQQLAWASALQDLHNSIRRHREHRQRRRRRRRRQRPPQGGGAASISTSRGSRSSSRGSGGGSGGRALRRRADGGGAVGGDDGAGEPRAADQPGPHPVLR